MAIRTKHFKRNGEFKEYSYEVQFMGRKYTRKSQKKYLFVGMIPDGYQGHYPVYSSKASFSPAAAINQAWGGNPYNKRQDIEAHLAWARRKVEAVKSCAVIAITSNQEN